MNRKVKILRKVEQDTPNGIQYILMLEKGINVQVTKSEADSFSTGDTINISFEKAKD